MKNVSTLSDPCRRSLNSDILHDFFRCLNQCVAPIVGLCFIRYVAGPIPPLIIIGTLLGYVLWLDCCNAFLMLVFLRRLRQDLERDRDELHDQIDAVYQYTARLSLPRPETRVSSTDDPPP